MKIEIPQQMKRWMMHLLSFSILVILTHTSSAQCIDCDLSWEEAKAFNETVEMEDMVGIPMRDGVILNSRIYFPKQPKKNLPTILLRTPYYIPAGDFRWFSTTMAAFLKNGFAVVINNERGRYWSEGDYTFLAGAKNDGYDAIEWIVNQPWSNGKVGTYGCSSSGEHQLGLATMNHPAHAAMIPAAAGAGIGEFGKYRPQGMFYRGGVVQMVWVDWYYLRGYNEFPKFDSSLTWEEKQKLSKYYSLWPEKPDVDWENAHRFLPFMNQLKNIDALASDFDQFAQRFPNDTAWNELDFARDTDTFGVPALHVNSWYDCSFGPSSMALFEHMQNNSYDSESGDNQYMIIAATNHCSQLSATDSFYYGDRFLGNAKFDYNRLYVEWFDYWLKGKKNNVTDRKKIQLYTMGKNQWEYFDEWPPKEAKKMTMYLSSENGANSKFGDGTLSQSEPNQNRFDEFIYDPANPVPSLGDNDWGYLEEMKSGSYDQSPVEIRQDVIVYSSPVLTEDLQITGPVEVILYLSSDVKDTDLTAKLVDVYPDGKAYNVTESIQRVRWREGYKKPAFMEKGKVYKVEIGPLLTSNQFKQGHKIRIEISSSNFPRFERNLNTGGNNYDETEWETATNRIHHGPEHPSEISFYVVGSK
jgi:putative CocE/NonD family hydrolase